MKARLTAAALGSALLYLGCAGDPAVQRWSAQWLEIEAEGLRGEPGSAEALDRAAQSAPTRADVDLARFGQARALRAQGRFAESFAIFTALGDTAMRRIDRSRARYETARMAETAGRRDEAILLFRRTVETYPGQPAALRSLQHIRHLTAEAEPRAQLDALRWSGRVYGNLARTPIGDDLAFMGAEIVYGWWRRTGRSDLAEWAERLLRRVDVRHFASGHWDDSVWMLSRLLHALGRFQDEIVELGRIFSTREDALIVGHYDTTYHWVGQLRIGRLQMIQLDSPEEAASTYGWFAANFSYSRWRDDARFWQGCALLRAGKPDRAESAFERIAEIYPDSKYLKRLEAARSDPDGAVCMPKEFEEDLW